jgi:hypothetical protein
MIAVLILASAGLSTSEAKIVAPLGTTNCASDDMHYHYCRVDTDNRVRLVRQISGSPCIEDRSWGYDRYGIWVDRGCRAEFEFGRDGGDGKTAAIVGGVAAAGILAAVIAARRNRDNNNDDRDDGAPNWLVGTFRGYNQTYGQDVEMRIFSDGDVKAKILSSNLEILGNYRNGRITLSGKDFDVRREGNGFRLTDRDNPGNDVVYRRDN